jgi:L-lactate dehydrogenase complex protein LldG
MDPAREEILRNVRIALNTTPGALPPPVPSTARVAPRIAGDTDAEIALLLAEIEKLTGVTRRLTSPEDLRAALAALVETEGVKKATLWTTPDVQALHVDDILASLGVELIPPQAGNQAVAECDLGVTGVDAALPETGTLVLRSSPEQSRIVSLVPRIHLALLWPAALRADLSQALADVKDDGYAVCVTGPSRTGDIELVLTIGVHGPKALYVWSVEWS